MPGTARPRDQPTPAATVVLHTPRALRRLLWAPGELGLGRAFASGDVTGSGELHPLGTAVTVLDGPGLEVPDLEALREHDALTLRA